MTLLAAEAIVHAVFAVGLALVLIVRKGEQRDDAGRTKFVSYYLVVHVILLSTLGRISWTVSSGTVLVIAAVEIGHLERPLVPAVILSVVGLGFVAYAVHAPLGAIRTAYTLVVVFDFASEIGGRVLGKRRVLPRISPGKTLAGVVSGVLAVFLVSSVLIASGTIPAGWGYVLASLVAVGAFTGDLLASLCKRLKGIKDFGSILPGQGGVLDRFDSFLLTALILTMTRLLVPAFPFG